MDWTRRLRANPLRARLHAVALAAFALTVGACLGFGAVTARAAESDGSASPPAPENAPMVSAEGVATMPDGSEGDPVDALDVYRFYNPYSGEHLFTKDPREIDSLLVAGWHDESIEWLAPEVSAMPMWRLYNPYTFEHLYTMDGNEYRTLDAIGWNGEGIFCYSAAAEDSVPVYRLSNPYVDGIGAHHYTTDPNERAVLLKQGWVAEGSMGGISCYGMTSDPIDDHEYLWDADVKWLSQDSWSVLSTSEPTPMATDGEPSESIPWTEYVPGSTGTELTVAVTDSQGADLRVGDVVAGLPGVTGPTGTALLVEGIEKTPQGYELTGRVPELGDVVDFLDVSGSDETADVTIDYEDGVTPDPDAATEPGEIALTLDLEALGLDDAVVAQGEHRFEIDEGINLVVNPKIDYDLTYCWFSIRRAKLVASIDTDFEFANITATKDFDQELFTYSFPVPWTLNTVWVSTSFSLTAHASGSISLSVHSHVEEGFDYNDGNFKWVSVTPYPDVRARFRGSLRGGVLPDCMLTVLGINTVYLGVEGGIGLDGEILADTSGNAYVNVDGYPYMKLFLNRKWNTVGGLLATFHVPVEFEVLNQRNAPHWNWRLDANDYQ